MSRQTRREKQNKHQARRKLEAAQRPLHARVARAIRNPHIRVLLAVFAVLSMAMSYAACTCGDKSGLDMTPLPGTVFYTQDHLGGPVVMTDEHGNVIGEENRGPWGDKITGTDEARQFADAEWDEEAGLYYMNGRYYDPKLGRFLTVDPAALRPTPKQSETTIKDPQALNPYSYARNSPATYVDHNGLEPTRDQVGTAENVEATLNNSPSKVGLAVGDVAVTSLVRFGDIKWGLPPKPDTGFFNLKSDRYVYTKEGGWIDMSHFMFYAGRALMHRLNGSDNPVTDTVKEGFYQEKLDTVVARHSAYSYEDLPSDKAGAIFGAEVFDPKSSSTLSAQVKGYLKSLGATEPQNAPNWPLLPSNDKAVRAAGTPSRQNRTAFPADIGEVCENK